MRLFQFDGYEFKLVEGELKQLGYQYKTAGTFDGKVLIGYKQSSDEKKIFSF